MPAGLATLTCAAFLGTAQRQASQKPLQYLYLLQVPTGFPRELSHLLDGDITISPTHCCRCRCPFPWEVLLCSTVPHSLPSLKEYFSPWRKNQKERIMKVTLNSCYSFHFATHSITNSHPAYWQQVNLPRFLLLNLTTDAHSPLLPICGQSCWVCVGRKRARTKLMVYSLLKAIIVTDTDWIVRKLVALVEGFFVILIEKKKQRWKWAQVKSQDLKSRKWIGSNGRMGMALATCKWVALILYLVGMRSPEQH